MRRTVRACLAATLGCVFYVSVSAQIEMDPRIMKTADTNNALMQARVTLPSGLASERYARITLRNTQSVIATIYTNKSGEFQIRNLSEGVYFVQAETVDGTFEPVSRRVELGRGLMVTLNLEMRERKAQHLTAVASRVV